MPLHSIFFVQKSFNYKPFFNILKHEKKNRAFRWLIDVIMCAHT